jgi:hypothetical protein
MAGEKREARLRADVPGIHVERHVRNSVDARDKPGHDELVGRFPKTEAGESVA